MGLNVGLKLELTVPECSQELVHEKEPVAERDAVALRDALRLTEGLLVSELKGLPLHDKVRVRLSLTVAVKEDFSAGLGL